MRYALPAGIGVVAFVLGLLVGFVATGDKAEGPRETESTVSEEAEASETASATDEPEAEPAPPPPAGLALTPAKFDFGKMLEGEAHKATFSLEKPKDATVKIGRLYSPCPCIRVSTEKRVLSASDEGKIEVWLHSLTLEGKKSFPAYAELLEPAGGVLRVDVAADVERVPAKMLVKPRTLHLGAVHGAKTAETKLYNLMGVPVRLNDVTCSLEGVKVTVPEGHYMAPGAIVTVRVDVPEDGLARGPIRGTVTVDTNCPEHTRIVIPVDGTAVK